MITTTKTAECYLNPCYGFKVVDAPFNGTCLTKDPNQLASLAKKGTAVYTYLQSTVDVNKSLRGTKYDNDVAVGYAWNPANKMKATEVVEPPISSIATNSTASYTNGSNRIYACMRLFIDLLIYLLICVLICLFIYACMD